MKILPHHPGMNCYDHSVHVSYVAFRLARRWKLDYQTAARAGLLHDLYLYNLHEKGNRGEHQCFAHPKAALKNARALCGELSAKEENIILSHMWPLSRHIPKSKEAFVVTLADKLCATGEVLKIYHYLVKKSRHNAHPTSHLQESNPIHQMP